MMEISVKFFSFLLSFFSSFYLSKDGRLYPVVLISKSKLNIQKKNKESVKGKENGKQETILMSTKSQQESTQSGFLLIASKVSIRFISFFLRLTPIFRNKLS